MLKQRIVTASCLAAVLLWAVFAWPLPYFAALLSLVAFVSCWEWSRLCGLRSTVHRLSYALVGGVLVSTSLHPQVQHISALILATLTFVSWLVITLFLLRDRPPKSLGNQTSVTRMLIAPPLFFFTLWGLLWLRESELGSPLLFLYVFCIVWLADIGAYFAGRRWGQTKLSPNISPGKTREGALGGLLAVLLWSVLFAAMSLLPLSSLALVVASLLAGVFSIYGDLFESAMKRAAGVKDSGALLPGHGGILDRIDSIVAAAPVFIFFVLVAS